MLVMVSLWVWLVPGAHGARRKAAVRPGCCLTVSFREVVSGKWPPLRASGLEHFVELVLVQDRYAELLGLGELGAGFLSHDQVVGGLGDRS